MRGIAGYAAPTATSAPKTGTPQALSVMTREVIEDQGAVTLDCVLRKTADATAGGYYGEWDCYRILGLDAAFSTYWDGLRGNYGNRIPGSIGTVFAAGISGHDLPGAWRGWSANVRARYFGPRD